MSSTDPRPTAENDVAREVEQALYDHREGALTCYDHPPSPTRRSWCCACGEHALTVSWRAHVAAHIARVIAPVKGAG